MTAKTVEYSEVSNPVKWELIDGMQVLMAVGEPLTKEAFDKVLGLMEALSEAKRSIAKAETERDVAILAVEFGRELCAMAAEDTAKDFPEEADEPRAAAHKGPYWDGLRLACDEIAHRIRGLPTGYPAQDVARLKRDAAYAERLQVALRFYAEHAGEYAYVAEEALETKRAEISPGPSVPKANHDNREGTSRPVAINPAASAHEPGCEESIAPRANFARAEDAALTEEQQRHERIRQNMLAMEAWPEGTTHDEKRLRGLLARRVGITYGDDGELQSGEPSPAIDFKRDSVDEIERKLGERGMAALVAARVERRSWTRVSDGMPPIGESVEVIFGNGEHQFGLWSGEIWHFDHLNRSGVVCWAVRDDPKIGGTPEEDKHG